ncbi:MAG: hypothetical protein J1F35_03460, partial [Erysipelotrichales bacterium]|nr:hypothetical protein [Erysipelotrichales bacterium]
ENRVKDLYRLMHHSDYGDICQPKYSPKSRKIDDAEKYFENIQNVFRKHSSYDAEKHRQEDDEKFEEIINILRKRYE